MIPTTNPTKKQRALPRVWARFFSIPALSLFTHQGKRYCKSVIPFAALHNGSRTYFAPWTRVQTDVLVRDARPGGKSGVQTVGVIQHVNESREFIKQPNSDNGVSGPTS